MRKPGGRIAVLAGALAALALCGPASASAATDQIVAGEDIFTGGIGGSGTDFRLDAGGVSQFFNGDTDNHNVQALQNGPDGKALFRTGLSVSPGSTVPVAGTQYLANGDYPFFCSIHPLTMSGTLKVTGNGELARPKVTVAVNASKLGKVRKKGKLPVKVTAQTVSANVALTAKLGKTGLGALKNIDLAAGQTRKLSIALSASGKSALKGLGKAKVKVSASVPFGKTATAVKNLS